MNIIINKKLDDLKKSDNLKNLWLIPHSRKLEIFKFCAEFIKKNEHKNYNLETLRKKLNNIPREEKLSDYIAQMRKDRV